MDVLVLGGTVFLGRAVVSEAVAAGAHVTTFNRGVSGRNPEAAEQIIGDRTVAADLQQLTGRHFDLVVDTCGFVPADVTSSADLLALRADHYAFVSTISVFPGWPQDADYHQRGVHQGEPDATRGDTPTDPAQAYGWLKSGCELAVLRAFGTDRTSVLRAGLIVGEHDSAVGRLPWWIDRVARGGEVLVPAGPDDRLAMIDARDLAAFALSAVPGTFEVSGPPAQTTRAGLLTTIAEVTGSHPELTYVDEGWLAEQDVEPWTEIPLWAPDSPSTFMPDTAPAVAAGLRTRPIEHTVAAVWAWQQSLSSAWRPSATTPGLAPAKERQLLEMWHTRSRP